jgi:putative ABC transport system permease protein
MESIWQDLRYAVRTLRKNPAFTFVAAFTIALGIGANTTIFSTLSATFFSPFSFPTTYRLTVLWEQNPEVGIYRGSVAPGNFKDWREQNQTFDDLIAIDKLYFDFMKGDTLERYLGYRVSAGFFDALQAKPLYGRTFTADEVKPGNEQLIVLSNKLWKKQFAADPSIVNQTLTVNGKSFTIIGVMPESFTFPLNGGELWSPLIFDDKALTNRDNHYLQVIGLLKPGITIEQARANLNAIAARAAQEFPESNSGKSVSVQSLTQDFTRGVRVAVPAMFGSVGFVLLIACANIANLLLVRGAARQKEMAIRLAMGASRWRLFRQLLTESLLLAILGGAIGLFLSVWGIEALAKGIPEEFSKFIPGWHNLGINGAAFIFTLIASVVTGLLFGLIPALQTTKPDLHTTLKESGKGASGKATRNIARNSLIVAEVALSLILLIGAGLMIRTFLNLIQGDFGFDPTTVLKMRVSLTSDSYQKPEQRLNFYNQLLGRLESLPGVVHAAAINNVPMGGSNNSSFAYRIGQTVYAQNQRPDIRYRVVTPNYFETMHLQLKEGRNFTAQDRTDAPQVAIVNEAFVKRFFPTSSPIGEQINFGGEQSKEIIGVTRNVMNEDMDEFIDPEAYIPYTQAILYSFDLVLRTTNDPTALTPAIRSEVAQLDKLLPLFEVKTMNQMIAERMSPKRLMTFMLAVFAGIALLLAAVGIYAVMSYTVTQRTHEIGIRMALGAQAANIFRLVVGHGVLLTGIGLIIGLAGALAMTRALSGLLYGVTATDAITFIGITVLLAFIALAACYFPARRATKVEPVVALRHE